MDWVIILPTHYDPYGAHILQGVLFIIPSFLIRVIDFLVGFFLMILFLGIFKKRDDYCHFLSNWLTFSRLQICPLPDTQYAIFFVEKQTFINIKRRKDFLYFNFFELESIWWTPCKEPIPWFFFPKMLNKRILHLGGTDSLDMCG